MQRRTFLSGVTALVMALAMMMIMLGATTHTATAQIVRACPGGTYTVDLSNLPNPACYPFVLKTSWGGGAVGWPPTGPYPGPGIYVEAPPTPPGMPLDFISVFGVNLPPGPVPYQKTVNTPCGPVCVVVCVDATGCLHIKVYPGPCPAVLFPCP
jgi:hypothetical protein